MFTERKVSVSISLYFYLQFKLVFNLKSWKIWGRWSTKYIHLFFMSVFHCHPRVLLARDFLSAPLQWMCWEHQCLQCPRLVLACLLLLFQQASSSFLRITNESWKMWFFKVRQVSHKKAQQNFTPWGEHASQSYGHPPDPSHSCQCSQHWKTLRSVDLVSRDSSTTLAS